jgi:hypothetical protein
MDASNGRSTVERNKEVDDDRFCEKPEPKLPLRLMTMGSQCHPTQEIYRARKNEARSPTVNVVPMRIGMKTGATERAFTSSMMTLPINPFCRNLQKSLLLMQSLDSQEPIGGLHAGSVGASPYCRTLEARRKLQPNSRSTP